MGDIYDVFMMFSCSLTMSDTNEGQGRWLPLSIVMTMLLYSIELRSEDHDNQCRSAVDKNMSLHRFRNCSLIRNHQIVVDDLWVRDGKIIDPEKIFFDEKILANVEYDCRGILIAPGYIDLQINGAFGNDFSTPTEKNEDILFEVAQKLTSHGVTAFTPTVVSSDPATYKAVLPKYKRRRGSAKDGATILGRW